MTKLAIEGKKLFSMAAETVGLQDELYRQRTGTMWHEEQMAQMRDLLARWCATATERDRFPDAWTPDYDLIAQTEDALKETANCRRGDRT